MVFKKFFVAAMFCLFSSTAVFAAHSSYSPMAPRQLSQTASEADYSYGISILPGNSIDSVDPFFRYVGWSINYYYLDRYILRPVAHGYAALPRPVQTGFGNFLSNLKEVNNTVNNAVLLDPAAASISLGRFLINSTLGLLGFIDVASYMGLERKEMDMGTVMGRYGVDQGMYMMIPVLGPSTERDLTGSTIDSWPYIAIDNFGLEIVVSLFEAIHNRAQLIDQEALIDNAVDPYNQTRTFYLMYREGKVHPKSLEQNNEETIDESYLDEIDSM